MTYTLAAVFEHRADANYARDALVSAGFDGHSIQLSDAASTAGAARQLDLGASADATDESMLDSVKHFFGRLFGTEHDDQRMIAEAIRRGHVVLTVPSASREQAERAAGILQAFGPVDIGRRQPREDSEDWRPAGAAMQRSDAGAMQRAPSEAGAEQRAPSEGGAMQRAPSQAGTTQATPSQAGTTQATPSQAGTEQRAPWGAGAEQRAPSEAGMEQRAPSEARMPDETTGPGTRQDAGMGTVRYPNQGSLNIQRGDSLGIGEDTYFRAHWLDTFSYTGGTYQEYDPAYRYGASMANSTTYQGSAWEEVEPALRDEWQRTYPESRWEKFKDAVRVGWERMTH